MIQAIEDHGQEETERQHVLHLLPPSLPCDSQPRLLDRSGTEHRLVELILVQRDKFVMPFVESAKARERTMDEKQEKLVTANRAMRRARDH